MTRNLFMRFKRGDRLPKSLRFKFDRRFGASVRSVDDDVGNEREDEDADTGVAGGDNFGNSAGRSRKEVSYAEGRVGEGWLASYPLHPLLQLEESAARPSSRTSVQPPVSD
jgi:hypothetical protein